MSEASSTRVPMLEVDFSGFFQVRLATDPDTTDEPRGISGYTFALPGEPDLDRVVRLQDDGDVVLRDGHEQLLGARGFGVTVDRVMHDGRAEPDHPLVGARVRFAPESRFQMRNYVLTGVDAGTEAIHPFALHFSAADGTELLGRDDVLYPADPSAGLWDVPVTWLQRRGGKFEPQPGLFTEVTGVDDPSAYRARRLELLRKKRVEAVSGGNTTEIAGLDKRIHELISYPPNDRRTYALTFSETRMFALNGPNVTGKLAGAVNASVDWPLKMVQGVWDCDLLIGWLDASIGIPTAA